MTSAALRPRPRVSAVLTVAALAAVGVYLAALGFGFTYDDIPIIVQNPVVHQLHVSTIMAARWWNDALYRPLTLLSFAIDWAISGGAPFVFHLGNIALHCANTVCVYALARRWLGTRGAGVAALLFAVHPVHVEAVANVVGRAELIATLGVLVSAIAYAEVTRRSGRARGVAWAAAVAGAIAAFAGKESAFALPALLLVVDWLEARTDREPLTARLRRSAGLWCVVTALWGAWLAVWFVRAGHLAPTVAPGLEALSAPGRALAMLPVVPQYVRLLVAPVHLSADYSPRYLVADPARLFGVIAGLAALAVTATVAVAAARRWPAVTGGILWASASLLVVCNVAFPSEILLAERTMYLPSVGAALALAAVGDWMLSKWRLSGALVVGLVVALACARTVTRVSVWRDNDALFSSIVRDAPGSYRAAWLAGMFAYRKGDRAGGRLLLESAVAINPRDAGLLSDLASRLEEDSVWLEAGDHFEAAYDAKSIATLYAARAIDDYVRAHALVQADSVVAKAWRLDSMNVPLRIARSDLADAADAPDAATDLRLSVARQAPAVWQYWIMTAEVAERAGRCAALDEALAHVRSVPAAQPSAAPFAARRGSVRCSR